MLNSVKPVRSVIPALILAMSTLLPLGGAHAETAAEAASDTLPSVRVVTSKGPFVLQLRPDVAPKTVENFLEYARGGFYNNTVFHRVIPGFMIQGGGFTKDLTQKPTQDPIVNEAKQTLKNLRGSIAMARTSAPDSATSQFFINVVNNGFLDAGVRGAGYAVFGKVTEGMGVVDAIAGVDTKNARGMANVPVEPVIIESVSVLEPAN
ncbi:peptidylprolyl isomerase [Marinobacter similis]|uniref:Peptidyl-prolyl cis-trans isomerase n=1 Tax=Marinobacter similis TaxID=1420916 RepID=W5YG44_9GAMM|nr:peptidylprolyl isomerase [Marinobacter similis]AHI27955.1 peptidyl-prolyl cis-trans isomerase [Marinobacter similis]